MNATETVKTTLAVLAQNHDKPFAERMRLVEEEVRPLPARIADALKRAAPVLLVLLGVGCQAPGVCDLVLSPNPALLEETEPGAARWSAASGCDVQTGPGGVPVLAQARVFMAPDADGKGEHMVASDPGAIGRELCAVAVGPRGRHGGWRVIVAAAPWVDCPPLDTAIAHELGHVLAANGGHADSGLMHYQAGDGDPIDAASLNFVCGGLACRTFAPEPEPEPLEE